MSMLDCYSQSARQWRCLCKTAKPFGNIAGIQATHAKDYARLFSLDCCYFPLLEKDAPRAASHLHAKAQRRRIYGIIHKEVYQTVHLEKRR
jgi:hypothetical protein